MPEDDQEKAIANHGFKPVDPMLLKFGATALGKICRVAANLRFAGSECSEVGARPSQQDSACATSGEYTGFQSQQV
jgi:hypothetical protein